MHDVPLIVDFTIIADLEESIHLVTKTTNFSVPLERGNLGGTL